MTTGWRTGIAGWVVGAQLLAGCGDGRDGILGPDSIRVDGPVAFVGATLVPMTAESVLVGKTVVVSGGRISAIVDHGASLPAGTTTIAVAGRFLMPALIDAHTHLRRAELADYPRAGVGAVRNMWGYSTLAARVDSVDRGLLLGPVVATVSSGLDASPGQWPETQFVDDPSQADQVVARMAGLGYRDLKVYQQLSRAAFDSIAASASRRGLGFLGHVPTAVPIEHALAAGIRSVEHLSGYGQAASRSGRGGSMAWADADPGRFGAFIAATLAARTWNCPTLAVQARIVSGDSRAGAVTANLGRFVRELVRAGAPVVAGSDGGIDIVPAGSGLHDELDALAAAGLSGREVLRAATSSAGQLVFPNDRVGVIEVGAVANLLVVASDPYASHRVLRAFDGLMLRGVWRTRTALEQSR